MRRRQASTLALNGFALVTVLAIGLPAARARDLSGVVFCAVAVLWITGRWRVGRPVGSVYCDCLACKGRK